MGTSATSGTWGIALPHEGRESRGSSALRTAELKLKIRQKDWQPEDAAQYPQPAASRQISNVHRPLPLGFRKNSCSTHIWAIKCVLRR